MNLWEKYDICFKENASQTAFCIGNRYYTYAQFTQYISGSQQLLLRQMGPQTGLSIGVTCHDTIETFAAIFAIWFSGFHFVPLHPLHPAFMNNEKVQQSDIQLVIDPQINPSANELKAKSISNKDLKSLEPLTVAKETDLAYILFTSGSTGKPKGVPINAKNMEAYVNGFMEIYPDLSSEDRFLQTYDLTSDASFTCYMIPLLLGASVHTLPAGGFKYLSIVKILQERQITFTKFTPSVLNYLRPYFKSLRFEALRHSHFGGEALPLDLVGEWSKCTPNAEISNGYGPTETTITCTIHRTSVDQINEHIYNGIVSIGKPFKEVKILIVNETGHVAANGEKGELCIGGSQVMEGYLNAPTDDNRPFYFHLSGGIEEKYYRSGDLAFVDEKGYLYFCGRKDDQLKISGYRIEPAEIEFAISQMAHGSKSRAFGFRNKGGTESIVVFIEQYEKHPDLLKENLRSMLPPAFIPEKIIPIGQFPLSPNGKVDKSVLFEQYSSQIYE